MKKYLIILLLLVTTAVAAWGSRTAGLYREAAFRADSLEAVADTVRKLELRSLGDTVAAYQLRVVQTDLERSELEEELGAAVVALRARATVKLDTVEMPPDTVWMPAQEDTVEVYEFGGSDGPFTFLGDARLYPNRTQIFTVRVTADDVPISAVITCGDESPVRSAHLTMTAPEPWRVVPSSVEQSPDVCNARSVPGFSIKSRTSQLVTIGAFAAGFLVAHLTDDGFQVARY